LKILLVAPGRGKKRARGISGRAFQVPPLALGILARLTPLEYEIELVDENLHHVDFRRVPDLVAITCLTASAPRAYEISRRFRELGAKVVLGGIHPSAVPMEAIENADCVAIGEAEGIWSRLLGTSSRGRCRHREAAPSAATFAVCSASSGTSSASGRWPLLWMR
jgi:radical SAM superfamily enzyme YgiQ (UPF0313 family)